MIAIVLGHFFDIPPPHPGCNHQHQDDMKHLLGAGIPTIPTKTVNLATVIGCWVAPTYVHGNLHDRHEPPNARRDHLGVSHRFSTGGGHFGGPPTQASRTTRAIPHNDQQHFSMKFQPPQKKLDPKWVPERTKHSGCKI